jgi:hypothetical protein
MSTLDSVLNDIQNSAVAHAISKSNHLVGAALQIVHVLGFIVLLASLVLISLRVLGIAFKRQPIVQVTNDAMRLIWSGLTAALVSGTLMFVANPKQYYFNWAFELKMLLLVIAVIVQVTMFRKIAASETPNPMFARIGVALSLVAWFSIGLAGRAVGFI